MPIHFIYMAIVFVGGIAYTIYAITKNKKDKANFLENHPNAAKIFYSSKTSITSEVLNIYTINGTKPVMFTEKMKPGFYAIPGEVTLNVSFTYTRPGIMYKSVSETIGPIDIEVDVKANREYILTYDRKKEEFIFTEKKN